MKIRIPRRTEYYPTKRTKISLVGEGAEMTAATVMLLAEGSGFVHLDEAVQCADYDALSGEILSAYVSPLTGAVYLHTVNGIYYRGKNESAFQFKSGSYASNAFFADSYDGGLPITSLFSGSTTLSFSGHYAWSVMGAYSFSSGTIHCGRFFGIDAGDPFVIRWSAYGVFDWSPGISGNGYIKLPATGGRALRLFSMGEKLVAVREGGITLLDAYGDPQHFAVRNTAAATPVGGVKAATCALLSGMLFFCAEGGLYAYQSGSVRQLSCDVPPCISSARCAVACADKYYVLCTHPVWGKGVYEYSATLSAGYFIGLDADALAVGGGEVCAFNARAMFVLRREGKLRGRWCSAHCDFGTAGLKFVRELTVGGKGDIAVRVTADGVTREFSGAGRHAVGMCGADFTFQIETSGTISLAEVTAEVRNAV